MKQPCITYASEYIHNYIRYCMRRRHRYESALAIFSISRKWVCRQTLRSLGRRLYGNCMRFSNVNRGNDASIDAARQLVRIKRYIKHDSGMCMDRIQIHTPLTALIRKTEIQKKKSLTSWLILHIASSEHCLIELLA